MLTHLCLDLTGITHCALATLRYQRRRVAEPSRSAHILVAMPDRRTFLAGAAAPMLLPASAVGANDRVSIALIGAGGRGRGVMAAFRELGSPAPAVCDVYEPNLAKGIEAADEGAQGYRDYREVLERNPRCHL